MIREQDRFNEEVEAMEARKGQVNISSEDDSVARKVKEQTAVPDEDPEPSSDRGEAQRLHEEMTGRKRRQSPVSGTRHRDKPPPLRPIPPAVPWSPERQGHEQGAEEEL